MLTPEREKWLAHLDDTDSVKIFSLDPKAEEKFNKVKKQIQDILGKDVNVLHKGATSLGISGQKEIDIYIPVIPEEYNSMVSSVEKIFGNPRSNYPLERTRFSTKVDGTKADVFVINEQCKGWIESCKFDKYLREHPESLKAYEKMKEEASGLSTQRYYRRKSEFINEILEKAK